MQTTSPTPLSVATLYSQQIQTDIAQKLLNAKFELDQLKSEDSTANAVIDSKDILENIEKVIENNPDLRNVPNLIAVVESISTMFGYSKGTTISSESLDSIIQGFNTKRSSRLNTGLFSELFDLEGKLSDAIKETSKKLDASGYHGTDIEADRRLSIFNPKHKSRLKSAEVIDYLRGMNAIISGKEIANCSEALCNTMLKFKDLDSSGENSNYQDEVAELLDEMDETLDSVDEMLHSFNEAFSIGFGSKAYKLECANKDTKNQLVWNVYQFLENGDATSSINQVFLSIKNCPNVLAVRIAESSLRSFYEIMVRRAEIVDACLQYLKLSQR